jgi:hypothetical protein
MRLSRRYIPFVCALILVVVFTASCSSDDGSDQPVSSIAPSIEAVPTPVEEDLTQTVATATVRPTIRPSPTVIEPTVSDVQLPELSLTTAQLDVCRISGDLLVGGVPRQGTAPAPTPTPIPSDGSRDREMVAREIAIFSTSMNPVMHSFVNYTEAMRIGWLEANSIQQQAAQLHVFGNRLAQLCVAASLTSVPPEIMSEVVGFGESIRINHEWAVLALDELNCCGTAKTNHFDVGFNSVSIEAVRSTVALSNALEIFPNSPEGTGQRLVNSDLFGLQMNVDDDAVVVRNSVDVAVVMHEREELLDPNSLGPGSWSLGTGIRIRRLRNGSELSVEEAAVKYEGLIARYGDPVRDDQLDLTVFDEIGFTKASIEGGWTGSTIIFVRDGFTYFIESMCHVDSAEKCESVNLSIESIREL